MEDNIKPFKPLGEMDTTSDTNNESGLLQAEGVGVEAQNVAHNTTKHKGRDIFLGVILYIAYWMVIPVFVGMINSILYVVAAVFGVVFPLVAPFVFEKKWGRRYVGVGIQATFFIGLLAAGGCFLLLVGGGFYW